ncbi:MAG: VWA domain-containing protein [Nitratireductor sp.]|nr:VWA domain-containing protein [Nitratireductor sp.]
MAQDKDSRADVPQRSAAEGGPHRTASVARKSGGGLATPSSASEIAAFLKSAKTTNTAAAGRLVFAMDATMSRQPSWDRAMTLQASMFDAVDEAGKGGGDGAGLSVQLVYFRGFGECRASRFVVNARALRDLMTGIECRGGQTQIGKVLSHVNKENAGAKVDALVFIGDAMEEDIDRLCDKAGRLGLKGTRCFFFQEGSDAVTERAFREMARLTRGAYFRLGPNSSRELAELLAAVASYARGGLKALQSSRRKADRLLLERLETRR